MFLSYQPSTRRGSLGTRLNQLKLDREFTNYETYVNFGWLKPTFCVCVPTDVRASSGPNSSEIFDGTSKAPDWADYWDAQWWIQREEIGSEEWFVHPYVRKGATRLEFFDHAVAVNESTTRDKLIHSGEDEPVTVACHYYFEWQLFQFADRINDARSGRLEYWRPGSFPHMLADAAQSKDSDFDVPPRLDRWTERELPFTWLAHFVDFTASFGAYASGERQSVASSSQSIVTSTNQRLSIEKKLGAEELMRWLKITPGEFEQQLKACFLTLAQEWRGNEIRSTRRTRPLWNALQSQIYLAVQWLCLTTSKPVSYFLDKYRYSHFGQDVWIPLDEVLEYPLWKAAKAVSRSVRECVERRTRLGLGFALGFAPSPLELIHLGEGFDEFDTYLDALGRFFDESTHSPDDDPFRPRSRTAWYRVIALSAEILLKKEAERVRSGAGGALRHVAELLGVKSATWNRFKLAHDGFSTDIDKLKFAATEIQNARTSDDGRDAFAFALYVVRNSTAHDSSMDNDWLYAPHSGPLFDALVLFVPWAAFELRKLPLAPILRTT